MWYCITSKFDFNDKSMSIEVIKGKEEKAMKLGWPKLRAFLAYFLDALGEALPRLTSSTSSASSSAIENCPHDDVENLWDGVNRDTDRWECMDCGLVFEDDDENEAYFI